MPITASMLYDLVHCPHRMHLDLFGDPARRDPIGPFVRLLWERGTLFEREVIQRLERPFLDLSAYTGEEKEQRTRDALRTGEPLIYAGRVTAGDLVGEPDLLRREGDEYVPGDIKSGAGEEGPDDDRRPKPQYAVQLALYVDVLEQARRFAGRRGFIWDIHGEEVPYDLAQPRGPQTPETWWDEYQSALADARAIAARTRGTSPANASICKQCHWRSTCIAHLEAARDLTLIPELGRAKRDAMAGDIASLDALATADISVFRRGSKTVFRGIGPDSLAKFQRRARLLCEEHAHPYLTAALSLPRADRELFFDIEVYPMRDVCYLHGFVERRGGNNATERYFAFFADEPSEDAEREAFARAWEYVQRSRPCAMYYYSKYERTHWKRLQGKYPSVCTAADVDAVFADPASIDLYYDVVKPSSEWPTRDYSIKTLAQYLGFRWRDPEPSGAASIEWYHRWVETRTPSVRQRLLEYNEDDCRATRVLLEGVRALGVGP